MSVNIIPSVATDERDPKKVSAAVQSLNREFTNATGTGNLVYSSGATITGATITGSSIYNATFGNNTGFGTAPTSTSGILYGGTLTGASNDAAIKVAPIFTSPASTLTNVYGVDSVPALAAGSSTVTNFINVRLEPLSKGAGSVVTNAYGLYVDTQTVGSVLNRSIYVAGGTTELNGPLLVDDTTQLSNNLSLGIAPAATVGIFYAGTITAGTDGAGMQLSPTFRSPGGNFGPVYGVASGVLIKAGSSSISNVINIRAEAIVKESGNTINGAYSLYVDQQTVGATINRSIFVTGGISEFDGQLIAAGTATNDSAAAGDIGELITSDVAIASAVGISSSTAANITSLSLTAGDWDVWGSFATNPAGTTTTSASLGWISTSSATLPTTINEGGYIALPLSTGAGSAVILPVGTRRISLASPTTVYLSCFVAFAVSTCSAYGYIAARRRR